MAAKNIVSPPSSQRELYLNDGITGVVLNNGRPAPFTTAGTFVFGLAFTPTSTSCSIGVDSGGLNVSNVSTPGASVIVGIGLNDALPFHIRTYARRKPGTSGAIVAQTVIIKDGADSVELGRFQVAAAAAGADPVSGWLDLPIFTDSRWTLGDGESLTVKVTAVDTDFEIVFEGIGTTTV